MLRNPSKNMLITLGVRDVVKSRDFYAGLGFSVGWKCGTRSGKSKGLEWPSFLFQRFGRALLGDSVLA